MLKQNNDTENKLDGADAQNLLRTLTEISFTSKHSALLLLAYIE